MSSHQGTAEYATAVARARRIGTELREVLSKIEADLKAGASADERTRRIIEQSRDVLAQLDQFEAEQRREGRSPEGI